MKYLFFLFFCFSSLVNAEVFSQDPTRNDLTKKVNQYSRDDLINIVPPDVAKKNYMVGLLYLRGSDGFKISKSCEKSVKSLKNSWEMGGADPGYTLSMMYYQGLCVEKDIDKSKQFLEESAAAGYLLSQKTLGQAYWGCAWCDLKKLYPKNMEKAIYWLSQAGDAGDRESSGNLSYIFLNGIGVQKNEEEAFRWRYRAAHSPEFYYGDIIVFNSLAEYYEKGIGTEKDLVQAYKYYDLAGTAGGAGKARIKYKMTDEQLKEAQRLSREWQEEHNVQVGGGWIQFN